MHIRHKNNWRRSDYIVGDTDSNGHRGAQRVSEHARDNSVIVPEIDLTYLLVMSSTLNRILPYEPREPGFQLDVFEA